MLKNYQNKFASYSLIEDILCVHYKAGCIINLQAAKKIVKDRLRFQEEISFPILCNITDVLLMDFQALEYLAKYGSLHAQAVALVSYNTSHLYQGKFYTQVHKPTVPTEIFVEKAAALAYLNQFKKNIL